MDHLYDCDVTHSIMNALGTPSKEDLFPPQFYLVFNVIVRNVIVPSNMME